MNHPGNLDLPVLTSLLCRKRWKHSFLNWRQNCRNSEQCSKQHFFVACVGTNKTRKAQNGWVSKRNSRRCVPPSRPQWNQLVHLWPKKKNKNFWYLLVWLLRSCAFAWNCPRPGVRLEWANLNRSLWNWSWSQVWNQWACMPKPNAYCFVDAGLTVGGVLLHVARQNFWEFSELEDARRQHTLQFGVWCPFQTRQLVLWGQECVEWTFRWFTANGQVVGHVRSW